MNPKPGNQPDPNDMAGAFGSDADADRHAHPNLAGDEAEEEAARLGDFA